MYMFARGEGGGGNNNLYHMECIYPCQYIIYFCDFNKLGTIAKCAASIYFISVYG